MRHVEHLPRNVPVLVRHKAKPAVWTGDIDVCQRSKLAKVLPELLRVHFGAEWQAAHKQLAGSIAHALTSQRGNERTELKSR